MFVFTQMTCWWVCCGITVWNTPAPLRCRATSTARCSRPVIMTSYLSSASRIVAMFSHWTSSTGSTACVIVTSSCFPFLLVLICWLPASTGRALTVTCCGYCLILTMSKPDYIHTLVMPTLCLLSPGMHYIRLICFLSPQCFMEFCKRSFIYVTLTVWNGLHLYVRFPVFSTLKPNQKLLIFSVVCPY